MSLIFILTLGRVFSMNSWSQFFNVKEDVDVITSISTQMQRLHVTLGEVVAKFRKLVWAIHNRSQQHIMYMKLCVDLNISNNNLLELDYTM